MRGGSNAASQSFSVFLKDTKTMDLPEFYVLDERTRINAPTYEALKPCQIILTSAETGITGPTRIEAGEIFSTEAVPCEQWLPLNRAAGERMQAWITSLPVSGKGLTQDEISEAAFAMRPREGEPEIPHAQWWQSVMKYAYAAKEKRGGTQLPLPRGGVALRPGATMAPMPFTSSQGVTPVEVGRAPAQQAASDPGNGAKRARDNVRQKGPMPGTNQTDAMAAAVG